MSAVNRFLTYTDWSGYLRYLRAVGDGHVRVTYDRGRLELRKTSDAHEQSKSRLGLLLEDLMDELSVDFVMGGSTTFKRKAIERGLEPDECYWIEHAEQVSAELPGKRKKPLPPPDLAIEVEVTRSVLDRISIYRSLGVREVWRYTKAGRLIVLRLDAQKGYLPQEVSPTFPTVPLDEIAQFARGRPGQTDGRLLREFRAWVRTLADR